MTDRGWFRGVFSAPILLSACANLSGLSPGGKDAGPAHDGRTEAPDAGRPQPDAAEGGAALPVALLYGGQDLGYQNGEGKVLDDTWSFDGMSWTKVAVHGASPGQRFGSGAASLGHAMLVFGGYDADGNLLNDTWSFQGDTWAKVDPGTGTAPTPRAWPAMAAIGDTVVVFGGELGMDASDNAVVASDTWIWNGSAWSPAAASSGPTGRLAPAMAAYQGKVLMFGGITAGAFPSDAGGGDGGAGETALADTWVWDGSSWTEQTGLAASPPARSYASMAAVGSSVVLFGGLASDELTPLGDTWVWDGTTWSEMQPAVTPLARLAYPMVSIPGAALLFGGSPGGDPTEPGYVDDADTWLWAGTTWSALSASGLEARESAMMVAF